MKAVRSGTVEADADVTASGSLTDIHRALVDQLSDAVVDVVATLLEEGASHDDYRRVLRSAGVDALDGRLADALARLAVGTDPEAESASAHALRASLDLLRRLGSGHVDGQPSGRDDVLSALPPLLAGTTEVEPTVVLRLGVEWAGRPRQQREDVLTFGVLLGLGTDLRLMTTDAAAHRLLDDDRDLVPAHVLRQVRNRHRQDGADETTARRREAAAAAIGDLEPEARPAGVVRALSRSATDSLSYGELASAMALDSRPYEAVRTAADHDLVERTERPDGTTVVSLRPTGDMFLDQLAVADGGRADIEAAASASTGVQTRISEHPQISPSMPCSPGPPWDSPHPDPDGDDVGRPAAEAADAADLDRQDAYEYGLVEPSYASRMDWIPAVEHAEPGSLSLVDVDLSDRLDVERDGRAPLVSFDRKTDSVYVAVEYSNPMQSAVALAHGLTCDLLTDAVGLADRLGDDLRGLEINNRGLLWGAVCLGYLPASVEDGDDYLDQLTEARDSLLSDSGATVHEDSEVTRSSVARRGLGLVGTMVAIYDLLGIDVVTELRVPECSRHFSPEGNGSRRDDLVHHIRMLSALGSRWGAFSVFRQLHEDRDNHREDAFTPGFEDGEHLSTGSLMGGLVLTGDGVEELTDDLDGDLDPYPTHEEAPPISVSVDVTVGSSRRRTSRTVRRMLKSRGLRPSTSALAVFSGVASTPWAASEAIHWGLKKEENPREIHLDEVRRALSTLSPNRILDETARSARDGVAALLDADEPLSQAELCRRAEISSQSWRNHRDDLVAVDWVRETEAGWRCALPFRSERGDPTGLAALPWYLRDDPDGRRHRADAVLTWLWERGAFDDDHDSTEPDNVLGHSLTTVDGLPRAVVDPSAAQAACKAAGVPPDLMLSRCASESPSTTTASLGAATVQASLVQSQTTPK